MTGDKDIELTLHYSTLSDTYIRYVDENGKPKANKVIATANNNVVSKKAANELSQTGENSDDALANLGLAFISGISLIGLASVKKRKN